MTSDTNRTARHFSTPPARGADEEEGVPAGPSPQAPGPAAEGAEDEVVELRQLVRHLTERLERLEQENRAYEAEAARTEAARADAIRVEAAAPQPALSMPSSGAEGQGHVYWDDDRYADQEDEPASPGLAATSPTRETERPRRGFASALAWLIVIAAIGVGGWWVWTDVRATILGEAPGDGTDDAPGDGELTAATTQGAADPAGADAEPETEATASSAAEDTGTGDTPLATEPDAQTAAGAGGAPETTPETATRASNEGPPVPAAPAGTVEAVPLDWDLAPLPEDAPAELRALAEAAMEGDVEAQHQLANVYALGSGVEQQRDVAAFWYRRASDAGHVNARYNLGVLLTNGWGVPQDNEEAFRLFLNAAQQGHSGAQVATGLAYAAGRGVPVNRAQAADWFRKANTNGNARGAYQLGYLYEVGIDGVPDLDSAAGWYRLAAEAGDAQAEEALERVIAANGGDPGRPPPAAASVPIPDSTPEPVPPGGGLGDETEMTRELIAEVQQRLNDLGFDAGPVDGLMGTRTSDAIRAFQESEGLEATGEATGTVLQALRSAGG